MTQIVWDVGTAAVAAGTIALTGRYVKLNLTTIPASLSQSDGVPPLYRNLGLAGPALGSARDAGEFLQWPIQVIGPLPEYADTLWYRLVNGVSGTLYRGVEMNSDVAVGCHVERTTAQSPASGAPTAVLFDSEVQDPFGMHSPGTNPNRVTVPVPGWYALSGNLGWAASAVGLRDALFFKNGTTYLRGDSRSAAGYGAVIMNHPVQMTAWLDAGDYIELVGVQTSGGALDMNANATLRASLSVVRLPG